MTTIVSVTRNFTKGTDYLTITYDEKPDNGMFDSAPMTERDKELRAKRMAHFGIISHEEAEHRERIALAKKILGIE